MGKEIKSRREAAEVILFADDFPDNISHVPIFPDERAEDGTDACLEYFKGEFDERIFWGTVYISPAERITDNHDERA